MWRYMKVYKAIWRYIKIHEGIWRYISMNEPTFSTLFLFQLFWTHLFDIVFCVNLLVVHFVDIVFLRFVEGLQASVGSSFFSREISRRMLSESCLGTTWGLRYEHICKNIYFWKGRLRWDPWLKRALNTISNGVLKIQHASILFSVMRILL